MIARDNFEQKPARWPSGRVKILVWMAPLLALLLWQRWELAGFAQWREDQATNLWIGSQVWRAHYFPPVGLISSTDLPNPNGMVWLGFGLSILPSLETVGFALALVQLALLARLCWSFFRSDPVFGASALLASASCIQVVLTGVEFWNQWVIGLVNLLFLAELRRLRDDAPRFWPFFWCVQCVLVAPALYVAGLVSSVSFVLLLAVVAWRKRLPRRELAGGTAQKLIWAASFAGHFCVVWLPYFFSVETVTIRGLAKPFSERLIETALTLGKFPITIGRMVPQSLQGLNQDSSAILGPEVYRDLNFGYFVLVALLVIGSALALWHRRWPAVAVIVGFCVLMVSLSPLLGGFAWGLGQRPDQVAQFYPLLVVAAFGALAPWRRLRFPVLVLALLFGASNWIQTKRLRDSLRDYRGPEMTTADLPLVDRRRAIDFVASDWEQFSNAGTGVANAVPIYYAFGADWKWIIERYGPVLAQWYSDEPYTVGRAYDWELRRRWGLANQDEGLAQAARAWRGQRYTLSMAGGAVPGFLPASARHFEFGRVRVSLVTGP